MIFIIHSCKAPLLQFMNADLFRDIRIRTCQGFIPVIAGKGFADQISLKDPRVTPEAIENALHLVGLWDTCHALPQGLATPYKPEFFSRGQGQLLSIARAVVMDPHILLFDEITANLDSLTESQVLQALQAAAYNRTVLSISHRLYEASGGRMIVMNGRES